MSKIVIEYNPSISIKAQKLIRDRINPSMISNDETSCQYDITVVSDLLSEFEYTDDYKLVSELENSGVHYIEF